jgi:GAF domain-containing protein
MDQVLTKLMKIAIENADAQRGCLLLAEGGQLLLEAEGTMNREEVTLLQSVPLGENHDLPLSVVRYVERTKEPLIVSDATREDRFTADVYVKEKQPKSILCTPLVKQGKLIGILYLENNLTIGAFPPDRLEVLTLLSSELAIAVENARLYTTLEKTNKQLGEYNKTLEQRVAERTQELSEKNYALEVANFQVQEANARKSQFLANMSHELRTPLTTGKWESRPRGKRTVSTSPCGTPESALAQKISSAFSRSSSRHAGRDSPASRKEQA